MSKNGLITIFDHFWGQTSALDPVRYTIFHALFDNLKEKDKKRKKQ
jgi:hypothetical protein